jgi:predicted RND superfamily exporter protein
MPVNVMHLKFIIFLKVLIFLGCFCLNIFLFWQAQNKASDSSADKRYNTKAQASK